MKQIKIITLTCNVCQHSWQPRKEYVGLCPKCKSPYFDLSKEELEKRK